MGDALIFSLGTILFGALFWAWFLRAQDRAEPEAWFDLAKLLILGAGLAVYMPYVHAEVARYVFAGVDVESIIFGGTTMFETVRLFAFCVFAAVEEIGKGVVLWLFVFHKRVFNQIGDGVMYGAMIALGFSVVENLGYLGMFMSSGFGDVVVQGTMVRTIATTLLHITASGLMGYGLARTKFYGHKAYGSFWAYAFGAIALHSFFNIFAQPGYEYVAFGALLLALGYLLRVLWEPESRLVWTPVWRRK